MRALNDHECVALVQQGDHGAFSELVRRYQHPIYRFILRMSGCEEEAMDLTQETFLKAYQGLREWRAEALFRTWLFRIASNTTLDTLRRRQVVGYVPLDETAEISDGRAGPESQIDWRRSCDALERGLTRIPHLYREALLLREVEGMTYSEIALALDVTEGTVKSRIGRARKGLLDILERKGLYESSKNRKGER